VTWCGAAYMYAKEILHYNMTSFVPCLLLVKAPHYHHLNLKTIAAKQANHTLFQIIGNECCSSIAISIPAGTVWRR
jgi:hypothetical protein